MQRSALLNDSQRSESLHGSICLVKARSAVCRANYICGLMASAPRAVLYTKLRCHRQRCCPLLLLQGIETVRRDGCPAVVKIQERAMRTLFETSDLSAVRSYLQRQWTKILAGRVSLQDFVFAKEVRHLGAGGAALAC
jgi:DNA polymerase family B